VLAFRRRGSVSVLAQSNYHRRSFARGKSVRALRAIVWLSVVVFIFMGLAIPAIWLRTAATLPVPIESGSDIETHIRQSVESERYSMRALIRDREKLPIKWERPNFAKIPKTLIAFFITETGCPTYFDGPPESGLPWLRRLWAALDGQILDGDGACELIYARRLAKKMGAKTPMELAVAADRIHRFLKKDELVAFDLASTRFERGVIGYEEASRVIMGKDVSELSLGEFAEFQLVLPPHGFWEDMRDCIKEPLIRSNRDGMLSTLAMVGLVSEEAAKAARSLDIHCATRKN
jgi:hypothetical protein